MQPTRTEILAILETYEGMVAQCNNGEGCDHLWPYIAKWEAALAALDEAAE
jgi:hypothetical protein